MNQDKNDKPTPDELHQQLGYLNLQFMQEHCEELAKQAAQNQWSHVEFLRRLVEGETAARQDRACQRRIRDARFPVLKTLDQFDFTWPVKINRLAVQNLFRLKFIQDRANAKSFDAFDFLVIAFLNIGRFFGKHDGTSGEMEPEFYTMSGDFIRRHHNASSSWQKVRLRNLEDQLAPFKGGLGFELIAKKLRIPRPTKVRACR